jgi:hypothetical protein
MTEPVPSLCQLQNAIWAVTWAVSSLLGCQSQQNTHEAAPAASSASHAATSTSPAEPPAWIRTASRTFEKNRGRRTERAELTFARVRFRLPKLSAEFDERHCPGRTDCRERTRYVRIRTSDDGTTFLPDCSVLDEERLLDELMRLGPWKGASAALESGQQLELVGRSGQRLGALLEFVEHSQVAAPEVWDEWLYARSMASAFTAQQGFDAPLLGQEVCVTPDNASVCEAELATLGNPLAILAPEPPACPVGVAAAECLRRYLLLPVDTGHFQNFCGRMRLGASGAQLDGDFDATFTPERRAAFTRWGIDVKRLLAGSAWTAFGHRVPQVDVFVLSRATMALGLHEELEPRLMAVAEASEVSFRNRFRARVLSLSFDGPLGEAALLREFRRLVPRCRPGTEPAECISHTKDDLLDRACVEHTLGLANWACSNG